MENGGCELMSDEKTCRNCVMYQDGYCNRDGMHADKTDGEYTHTCPNCHTDTMLMDLEPIEGEHNEH